MDEIEFLSWDELMAIHTEQLELYGGADGFIDKGVAESAFNRPHWKAMYGDPDHAELAGEYLFGLATTQGFSDGNKRTALNAALHFLWKNGYTISATNDELYAVSLAVSTNELTREALADWIRDHIATRE